MSLIFKIVPRALWTDAEKTGTFTGASVDHADGFIHFSTAAQVEETAAKHFAGQRDLMLVALDDATCGPALRWEPSRGGALFPHLYRTLAVGEVAWAMPLPYHPDGRPDFTGLLGISR